MPTICTNYLQALKGLLTSPTKLIREELIYMSDINSVNITGRATKDVELRNTNSGRAVATISVAVNGINDEVNYFDVVCWNKTAEIASQYVKKGKQIAVNGRLQQRTWNDNEGTKRYAVEIVANQLTLLGGNTDDNRPLKQHEVYQKASEVVLDDIDDKPINLSDVPF